MISRRTMCRLLAGVAAAAVVEQTMADVTDDPLARWRGATVKPVLANADGHTLHSYFGISPESPDESSVLLFRSKQPDAHVGDIVSVDRRTGQTLTLAEAVECEDGHRQANQQWVCNGRYVVYMAMRNGTFEVVRVDPQDLSRKVLATGRQLGWGQPTLDVVPLYGQHWNPGEHRDLELLNVLTGEIRTVVTADQAVKAHGPWVEQTFGAGSTISLFFPQMSPDGRRLYVKMSSPRNGDMRSPGASKREGLFVFDLTTGRNLGRVDQWGHPTWFSDSRHIQSCQWVIDTDTMQIRTLPNIPLPFGGVHSIPSPDGKVVITDISRKDYLNPRNHWTIWAIDPRDGRRETLHIADVEGDGTTSWRPVHPHPAFNARGNRVYFNAVGRPWTTLNVIEASTK